MQHKRNSFEAIPSLFLDGCVVFFLLFGRGAVVKLFVLDGFY